MTSSTLACTPIFGRVMDDNYEDTVTSLNEIVTISTLSTLIQSCIAQDAFYLLSLISDCNFNKPHMS